MRFPRSRLLAKPLWPLTGLVALALAFFACSGAKNEAKAPTETPTITPTATITSTPPITSTPEPTTIVEPPEATPEQAPPPPTSSPPGSTAAETPLVEVIPPEIGQGQTAVIELPRGSAAGAAAFCDGRLYPLIGSATSFWGVIGASGDADVGAHAITVQLLDGDGNVLSELSTQVIVVDMGYPVENIDLPPGVNSSLDPGLVQQETAARNAIFSEFTTQKLWSGPFIWPAPQVIVSPYGIRRSYNGGPVNSFHGGIDLAVDEGTPVAASNTGRVAYIGSGPVHGNAVLIDHGDGVFSGYNHLSVVNVQVGQMVTT
jgi:hypothetical protein